MNTHIYDFLEHYIHLDVPPEYAILLTGQWGSGKTFFINNFLEREAQKNGEKKKFVRISLFGVKSVNEVHKQIIFQLFGTKQGSLGNDLWKIGAGALDALSKKLNLGLTDIPIDQILRKYKQYKKKEVIFIFDDLERIAIEIPEILGYINILVEQLNNKCILLANEDSLIKKELYSDFKEKVIGKSFNIQQDFEAAFDTFLNLSTLSKDIITTNQSTIKSVFENATYNNLRHIRQTILDFEYFYENIENRFREHKQLMHDVIQIFFTLSIEIKNGTLMIDDLQDYHTIFGVEYYLAKRDAEDKEKQFKKKNLDIILEKYTFFDKDSLILTQEQWIILLKTGILTKKAISESFNNSKYFIKTSPREWLQLILFSSLEDDEFQSLLKTIVTKFNNNDYTQAEEILHIVGILLALSRFNLYEKDKKQIVAHAKKIIDNSIDSWKFRHDLELREAAFGYGYWDYETDEFQEVKEYMINKHKVAINIGLIDIGKELISSLVNNDIDNFKNILSRSSTTYALHDLPLFSQINKNDFFDALIQLKNTHYRDVFVAIEERYKHSYSDDLIDELEFWKKFEILLDAGIENYKKSIKGYWLGIFKTHTLQPKIIAKLKSIKANTSA